MTSSPSRAECLVQGRVQGVCFRAVTQEVATALGLSGWVRNLADGRVQFVAEGPEGDIARLIQWAWIGSDHARVDHVDVVFTDFTGGEPNSFEIRGTAATPEAQTARR